MPVDLSIENLEAIVAERIAVRNGGSQDHEIFDPFLPKEDLTVRCRPMRYTPWQRVRTWDVVERVLASSHTPFPLSLHLILMLVDLCVFMRLEVMVEVGEFRAIFCFTFRLGHTSGSQDHES